MNQSSAINLLLTYHTATVLSYKAIRQTDAI